MAKIKILIVDDAVVVRKVLSDVLSADPELEVVGTASNGRIALARLEQFAPDVILLDIEMPEMDGLQTLAAIRKTHARLPVIMFSTLTHRGASATLDALSLGASDYVNKPSNTGNMDEARRRLREEMIPKIKHLCRRESPRPAMLAPSTGALSPATAPKMRMRPPSGSVVNFGRIELLVIGVSTGGPNALAEVMPSLPGDLPVPVLIVQHMPPIFTQLLAERLDKQAKLTVREAADGDAIHPGGVWIAPGDYHMTISRSGGVSRVSLNQGPPENFCRPAVDVLFRSAAETYGATTLAVVLTGMGQDGFRGSELIRDAGGQVLAQDEATSVVWGMPGFVARSGLAERVLPLKEIAPEILRRVTRIGSPPAPGVAAQPVGK